MQTIFRTFYEVTKDNSKWYSQEYVEDLKRENQSLKSENNYLKEHIKKRGQDNVSIQSKKEMV